MSTLTQTCCIRGAEIRAAAIQGASVCVSIFLNLLFLFKHLPGHPGRGPLHPVLHQLLQGVPPLQGGADREGGLETLRPRRSASHIFHPLPWKHITHGRGGSQQGASVQPGLPASTVQRRQLRASTCLQWRERKRTSPSGIDPFSGILLLNLCHLFTAGIQIWGSPPCLHRRQPCCASHHTPASHTPGSRTNTVAAITGDITHTGAGTEPFLPSLFKRQWTQHEEHVCRGDMFTASSAKRRLLKVFSEPPKSYPGNRSDLSFTRDFCTPLEHFVQFKEIQNECQKNFNLMRAVFVRLMHMFIFGFN